MLDRDEIARRFPQVAPPQDAVALYEPAAGFLLPERVIAAHVELAQRHGAEVRLGERVLRYDAKKDHVTVATDRGHYTARRLILTLGAWTTRLAGEIDALRRNLLVTRQAVGWFRPLRDDLRIGQMPVWAIDRPGGGLHYGFPVHPADDGFKAALHFPAEPTDPDALDRSPRDHDVAAIRGTIDAWLPGAAGPLVRHATCMYTNTPDGHFILDRDPGHPQVIVASCCSGHGFKFSSVIGEALADLAEEGRTSLPIDLFKISRLAR
jgi:sarcosine oxidase